MIKLFQLLLLLGSNFVWGSPSLDDQYSYKGFVAGVINAKKQPVFSEQIETELISLLQANPRFEFLEKNQPSFREGISKISTQAIHPATTEKLKVFEEVFKDQYVKGSRAVVLAELLKKEEEYEVGLKIGRAHV